MTDRIRSSLGVSVGTFSQSLYDEAMQRGWIVISMKDDWKTIFGE